jgi:hypothetical protein
LTKQSNRSAPDDLGRGTHRSARDLRWRGRQVDLLAVDEATGTALLIEIRSGLHCSWHV